MPLVLGPRLVRDDRCTESSPLGLNYLPEWMLSEECPHQLRRVDAASRATDEPFGQPHAARPGVAAAVNGVKHHGGIVSALLVRATSDIGRYGRLDRIRRALVSPRPIRRPSGRARKRPW